jgi:hypothetical protein
MAHNVFNNGREVVGKASSGKTTAAAPDVCFGPGATPGGPVPTPYTNTASASDTTSGSTSVLAGGQVIYLYGKSYLKPSTGDEPGNLGGGIVSHTTKGEARFIMHSFDLLIEGKPAVRHADMTINNGQGPLANTPPMPHLGAVAIDTPNDNSACKEQRKKEEEACGKAKFKYEQMKDKDGKPKTKKLREVDEQGVAREFVVPAMAVEGLDCSEATGCAEARACTLKPKKDDKTACCMPDNTGHHLVEAHCFSGTGERGKAVGPEFERYKENDAPCACASQARDDGTHGIMHKVQGMGEAICNTRPVLKTWDGKGDKIPGGNGARAPARSHWTYAEARDIGVIAHSTAFPKCNADCIREQLDTYHKQHCGIQDDTPVRSDPGVEHRSCGKLTPEQEIEVSEKIDQVAFGTTKMTKKGF